MTRIIDILGRGPASGARIAAELKLTRQAVHSHLKELLVSGRAVKTGVTRGALYQLAGGRATSHAAAFSKAYLLEGLSEDAVFREITLRTSLARHLPVNVRDILQYAFTEMLNNAIDHSRSVRCTVDFRIDAYRCGFAVRDFGIGLFRSIAEKLDLADEGAAACELLKGKTTTMPERHTGEGIFFTSKAGDRASFRSRRLELDFDGKLRDVFLKEGRFLEGTEVRFEIARRSRRKLQDIFEEFAPADLDYRFDRTRVLVKLFHREYVSRSEARRLLAGLHKFRRIELDFRGVRSLGQGFADEIFRVFPKMHAGIEIRPLNLSPALEPVLRHVIDNSEIDKIDNGLTKALPENAKGRG